MSLNVIILRRGENGSAGEEAFPLWSWSIPIAQKAWKSRNPRNPGRMVVLPNQPSKELETQEAYFWTR